MSMTETEIDSSQKAISIELQRERSLSRRIIVLLLFASMILIGQSVYNLSNLEQVEHSIVTMHNTASRLAQLASDVTKPMADIRILSMQLVLSPNEALAQRSERGSVTTEKHSHCRNGLILYSDSPGWAFSERTCSASKTTNVPPGYSLPYHPQR